MSCYSLERLVPETLICDSEYVPVWSIKVHPAGQHAASPIKNDHVAVECMTPNGSRWFGTDRAWIGSDLRVHIMVNPRDEVRRGWEAP